MDNINETTMMTVISVLGEKVQTLRAEMETETSRLNDRVFDLEDELQEMKAKVASLLDEEASLKSEISYYQKCDADHRAKIQTMTWELSRYRQFDPAIKEKAEAYMKDKGQYNIYTKENTQENSWSVLGGIRLIDNIKEVRQMTGWGLKETKDFCEEWMKSNGYAQDKYHAWVKAAKPLVDMGSESLPSGTQ